MLKTVTVQKRTKKLISQLGLLVDDKTLQAWSQQESDQIDLADIVSWLSCIRQYDKTSRFLSESLHASLLHDLDAMFIRPAEEGDKKDTPSAGWFGQFQFIFLAVAGTILAVCQGFDGIASILRLSSAVPTTVIFIAGFAFSILSVGVFLGFDLVEISKNIGVKVSKSHHLLDVFLEQVEHINKITKAIDDCYTEVTDIEELQVYKDMVVMFNQRHRALDDAREVYTTALNKPYLNIAKLITSAMSGVLFFSGGFFAGQSLISSIVNLFTASVAATAWPIVLTGIAVGFAALCIYWFVERPGFENLVSRWLGLDKSKIEALANDDLVRSHTLGLQKLERKLTRHMNVQQQMTTLRQKIEGLVQGGKMTPPQYVDQAVQTDPVSPQSLMVKGPYQFFNGLGTDDIILEKTVKIYSEDLLPLPIDNTPPGF